MSNIVIAGDTSGSVTLQAPAVAGGSVQTFTSASGTIAPLVSGTAVTASGTSFDFTGIPNWAKRITVMFSGVSLSGNDEPIIQLGDSGGVEVSGYVGTSGFSGTSNGSVTFSNGFVTFVDLAAGDSIQGQAVISLLSSSSNTWVYSGNFARPSNYTTNGAGSKSLSATLDRIRITTVNGTDTFDAGTVNIMYEG